MQRLYNINGVVFEIVRFIPEDDFWRGRGRCYIVTVDGLESGGGLFRTVRDAQAWIIKNHKKYL